MHGNTFTSDGGRKTRHLDAVMREIAGFFAAILEAILRMWPCDRLRVADRGLREGILTTLMVEDGVLAPIRRRRRPA